MPYHIKVIESAEGWTEGRPALLDCHSQGATWEETVVTV